MQVDCIDGSATLTMKKSSTTMNVAGQDDRKGGPGVWRPRVCQAMPRAVSRLGIRFEFMTAMLATAETRVDDLRGNGAAPLDKISL